MARFPSLRPSSWATAIVSSLAIFSTFILSVRAQDDSGLETIQGTNAAGETSTLLVDRYPALYSGDFGDCMGGQSLLNLTSFDGAYYADNMTVLFNLAGTTNLRNESLMCMLINWFVLCDLLLTLILVYISVYACKTYHSRNRTRQNTDMVCRWRR